MVVQVHAVEALVRLKRPSGSRDLVALARSRLDLGSGLQRFKSVDFRPERLPCSLGRTGA